MTSYTSFAFDVDVRAVGLNLDILLARQPVVTLEDEYRHSRSEKRGLHWLLRENKEDALGRAKLACSLNFPFWA